MDSYRYVLYPAVTDGTRIVRVPYPRYFTARQVIVLKTPSIF